MKHIYLISILASLFSLLLSCSEDSDALQSYRQDLAELRTAADGVATDLWLDNGKSVKLLNPINKLTPDSIYRVYTVYTEQPEGALLSSCSLVHSPMPVAVPADKQQTDPLEVLAAWKTDRYANLLLRIKTMSGSRHSIGFHLDQLNTSPNGKTTLHLKLMHNSLGAPQHYSSETYVSCPLYELAPIDTVKISVNTLEGETLWTLF